MTVRVLSNLSGTRHFLMLASGRFSPLGERKKLSMPGELRPCTGCFTKHDDDDLSSVPAEQERISPAPCLDDCPDDCIEPCTQDCIVVSCDEPCAGDVCLDAICENSPRSVDRPWEEWPCYDETCNQLNQMLAECCAHSDSPSTSPGLEWRDGTPYETHNHVQHCYSAHDEPVNYGMLFKDTIGPLSLDSQASMERSTTTSFQDQADRFALDQSLFLSNNLLSLQTNHTPRPNTFQCQWSGCLAALPTMEDLVNHVNIAHLLILPSSYQTAPPVNPTAFDAQQSSLACLWADCNLQDSSLFPDESVGYPSSRDDEQLRNALVAHMMHDHLGLNPPHLHPPYSFHFPSTTPSEASTAVDQHSQTTTPFSGRASPSIQTPVLTPSPILPPQPVAESSSMALAREKVKFPPPPPSSSITHPCHWIGCDCTFTSAEDLTSHLTDVHVGSGKNTYDCGWEGCDRSGGRSFTSKQKILRHLQSHTGHRPFRCEQCDQMFSEAATLQQHMRRHTQEKPYVCDFPGCGKAFAITGALTIHKRVHNGEKPFKCTYCDRSFSESSNLSKHLRTHTGVRPYACTEPNCSKRFARPDQLTRHTAMHRRKDGVKVQETVDEEAGS